jgi:hypothetical protein
MTLKSIQTGRANLTALDPDVAEETADAVLLEIAEDARRLKNRYAKETVVPEGGE